MENKDNQVIITGVNVYDIRWNTSDKTEQGLLPVEVDLPFRTFEENGDEDGHGKAIEDALTALYGFKPADFSWNYKYENLGGKRKDPNKEGFFIVSRVHRDDLEKYGFDTEKITDKDMEDLAACMDSEYLEYFYWESLEGIARDRLNFPMKEE